MKRLRFPALLAAALTAFTACDEVDMDERFIEETSPVLTPTAVVKNVLIEDFTGQRCVNCPYAAETVAQIQAAYPGNVIAVSIHGGSLAVNEETSASGLATAQGYAYNDYWGVESWPKGLVDRTGGLQDHTVWLGTVIERLGAEAKVDIAADALNYDAATRQLTVQPTVTAGDEAVTGRLQVWLTESHIIGAQMMPDGSGNTAYEHNHVFRASLNDAFGDQFTIEAGEMAAKEYTYTLPQKYVPANCALVIFFYNEADGVMQVIEKPVIATSETNPTE